MENKKVVEVMAGNGRHVDTYKKFNPKKIVIVDFNEAAI